jgi:hypothetical protein
MRKKLARLFRKIATRLDNPYPAQLWNRAVDLVNSAETFTGASGEFKRHKVYAQLIKDYPMVSHNDIGLMIELIIKERN